MFSIIAAIGKNGELGKKGELVFHIKDDMKFFRDTTSGHKILMGRKTWESLPGKLKNRENFVISSREFDGPDRIIHDLNQFITDNASTPEEIFVIGGGTVYEKLLPHCQHLYLTEVDAGDKDADTFFSDFDKSKYSAQLIKKGKENDLAYSIIKYIKN